MNMSVYANVNTILPDKLMKSMYEKYAILVI